MTEKRKILVGKLVRKLDANSGGYYYVCNVAWSFNGEIESELLVSTKAETIMDKVDKIYEAADIGECYAKAEVETDN